MEKEQQTGQRCKHSYVRNPTHLAIHSIHYVLRIKGLPVSSHPKLNTTLKLVKHTTLIYTSFCVVDLDVSTFETETVFRGFMCKIILCFTAFRLFFSPKKHREKTLPILPE